MRYIEYDLLPIDSISVVKLPFGKFTSLSRNVIARKKIVVVENKCGKFNGKNRIVVKRRMTITF